MRAFTSSGRPRALFVMPSFEVHAQRQGWNDLEEFYNPGGVFERVVLASIDERREEPEEIGSLIVEQRIRPRPHPHWLVIGESVYGKMDRFAQSILCLARKHEIDIVVQRYGSPLWHGVPVVWVGRQLGIPSVITHQADYYGDAAIAAGEPGLSASRRARWVVRQRDRAVRSYLHSNASRIWAVSDFLRKGLMDQGVDSKRIVTISNKDNMEQFSRSPSDEERRRVLQMVGVAAVDDDAVFLCVGRLIEEKNYIRVLTAFAAMRRRNGKGTLLIVGQGYLEAEVRKLIKLYGLGKSVVLFTDYLRKSELTVLYQWATALVFCSISEGQGRVVLESLAAGTPVIAGKVGPMTELIVDGETGLFVDPYNLVEIERGFDDFVCGKRQKEGFRSACIRSSRQFDLHVVNPHEIALYQSLTW